MQRSYRGDLALLEVYPGGMENCERGIAIYRTTNTCHHSSLSK